MNDDASTTWLSDPRWPSSPLRWSWVERAPASRTSARPLAHCGEVKPRRRCCRRRISVEETRTVRCWGSSGPVLWKGPTASARKPQHEPRTAVEHEPSRSMSPPSATSNSQAALGPQSAQRYRTAAPWPQPLRRLALPRFDDPGGGRRNALQALDAAVRGCATPCFRMDTAAPRSGRGDGRERQARAWRWCWRGSSCTLWRTGASQRRA